MEGTVEVVEGVQEKLEPFQRILQTHPFRPHLLLWNGHLQTLVGSRIQRQFPWGWRRCEEHPLDLSSGERVMIRWVCSDRSAPTLLLVHGMAGSFDSQYMLGLSHKAYRCGWNSILLSLYNLNHGVARPKVFHAGCSRDLLDIMGRAVERFGLTNVLLAGISMGGNIVLKMLGELGGQPPDYLCGAAVISPLVDLPASWPVLERGSNRLYRKYYVARLQRLAIENAENYPGSVDLEALRKVRTIREFDAVYTAPLSGFRGVDEYYEKSSASPVLGSIRVPTFVLHSTDDPLLPSEPLLANECQQNPWLKVVLTRRGGHVAFLEAARRDIDRSWAENRLIDYFLLLLSQTK